MPPSLCSAVMGESSPTTLLVRAANSLSDVECSPFLCTCEVPLSFPPNMIHSYVMGLFHKNIHTNDRQATLYDASREFTGAFPPAGCRPMRRNHRYPWRGGPRWEGHGDPSLCHSPPLGFGRSLHNALLMEIIA